MASSINKVILVGNLVKDPRLDRTPMGTSVCNATVATNHIKDKTQFTNIVVWNKGGELFAEMSKKGSRVYLEGYLNTHIEGETRNMEVVVLDFIVLDRISKATSSLIEDSIKDLSGNLEDIDLSGVIE
jgi:single stranded DNA-binding protein